MNIIEQNHEALEKMIDYERDYLIDYFGYKTLERAYLLRINKVIVELIIKNFHTNIFEIKFLTNTENFIAIKTH